jgi:hypothetical protein
LEYIYYSVGLSYFEKIQTDYKSNLYNEIAKQVSNVLTGFSLQLSDIETLLFDISSSTRGIGGLKQAFKIDDLPSSKWKKQQSFKDFEEVKEETEEEKLERHRKFFSELKNTFKGK